MRWKIRKSHIINNILEPSGSYNFVYIVIIWKYYLLLVSFLTTLYIIFSSYKSPTNKTSIHHFHQLITTHFLIASFNLRDKFKKKLSVIEFSEIVTHGCLLFVDEYIINHYKLFWEELSYLYRAYKKIGKIVKSFVVQVWC